MKRIFYSTLIVGIVSFLLLSSIDFDIKKVIDGGDTRTLLNPKIFTEKGLTAWETAGLGGMYPILGSIFFYAAPLYLLQLLFNNIQVASLAYYIILFSIAPVSMFLLSYEITKDPKISCMATLFYAFNLFTALLFHTPVANQLYFFGALPLLTFLFYKTLQSKGYKHLVFLILTALSYLPLIQTTHIFFIYLAFVPVVSFILLSISANKIKFWHFLRLAISMLILVLLFSAPFLYVTFLSGISMLQNPVAKLYANSSMDLGSQYKLIDILRGAGTYAWLKSLYVETSGIQAFTFNEKYQKDPFFIAISFYFILLPILCLLIFYRKTELRHRVAIMLFLLLVIVLFFIIQYIQLLAFISELTTIFRSAWKYFTPSIIFSFSLIMVILFNSAKQKVNQHTFGNLLLFFIIIYLIYISPTIVLSKFIHKAWIVEIPNDYYNLAYFLNNEKTYFRVLPLPLTQHFVGYVPYKWGYVGPDVLYTLTDKPEIDKYVTTVASEGYLDVLKRLETSSFDETIEIAKSLNVKYILLRNDVDEFHPYVKLFESPQKYEKLLENSTYIKKKYVFGNLSLYELVDYEPRISAFINQNELTQNNTNIIINKSMCLNCSRIPLYFTRINPTLWKAHVNATQQFLISFVESYNPLWEARVYKNGQRVETVKAIPLYGLINGFQINTTGENLDVEIRYVPQDWFEIGLVISGTTFVLCIGYLVYDWRREKGDRWTVKIDKKTGSIKVKILEKVPILKKLN